MKIETVEKGSSLITVILVFSVIITFGLAIFSLTLSAYKSSIAAGNVKRNQYFSESGINIAYGIIGNVVDEAIKQGNTAANGYMSTLNDNKDTGIKGILSSEKEKIKNGENCAYPQSDNPKKSVYINDDGSINETYIKGQQNLCFQEAYKNYVLTNVVNSIENGTGEDDNYNVGEEDKPVVKVVNDISNPEEKIEFKSDGLKLKLQSNFEQKGVKKTISAEYDISVPNYNEPYYVQSNKIKVYNNPVWSKAICADGNLDIKGEFSATGDVYAQGKANSDGNSGILIHDDSNVVTFNNGHVATAGDFRIIHDADNDGSSTKQVTAGNSNIYTGSLQVDDEVNNINLTAGTVYANNDLVMDGEKTNIQIDNFYGINDITDDSHTDITSASSSDEKLKNSSSILINSDDIGEIKDGKIVGSQLAINTEALLMGTAYVETSPYRYQTGESVAIKGNYKAYTYPLNSDEAKNNKDKDNEESRPLDENNIIFEYLDPLQLATERVSSDGIIKPLDIFDKIKYFLYYDDEDTEKGKNGEEQDPLVKDGVILPADNTNIISTGVVISNGNISTDNHTMEQVKQKAEEKQTDYAKFVYEMGDNTGATKTYDDKQVEKTVSTQVNFSNIDSTKNSIKSLSNGENEVIYLNKDEKEYALVGSNASTIPSGQTAINLGSKTKGIIIVNGNLHLYGNIDFTGTIIANGDITVEKDGQPKNIKYDENYVKKTIAYNYDYFKGIFIGNSQDSQVYEVQAEVQNDNTVGTDIIRDKLIKTGKWKIEQ